MQLAGEPPTEQQLRSAFFEARTLAERGSHNEAIELAESALSDAERYGDSAWSAEFHMLLSTCLRLRGVDVREDLDRAIHHMRFAAAGAPNAYMQAEREMNLAALYGVRRNGDPTENVEEALRILRQILQHLGDAAPPWLRLRVMNNLARALQDNEAAGHLVHLREAQQLGEEAINLQSPSDDPEAWAIASINLAETIKGLAGEGEADRAEAERHLRAVVGASELESVIPSFVGVAHAGLGELHLERAVAIAKDTGRIALGEGEPPPPTKAEREELLAAQDHLEAAVRLIDPTLHGWHLGSSLDYLARVYGLSGDEAKEIITYRHALQVQDANAAAEQILRSGFGLGLRFAENRNWVSAAQAFMTATEASDSNLRARLDNVGRQGEMRRAGNIARWASFALAKTGEIEKAILVLENGRTRDMRRRLGGGVDEGVLERLPDSARSDYERALEKLATAAPGEASDAAARELQKIITNIRSIPSFEEFATGVTWSTIIDAVESGWPLIYINPTPWGIAFLSVQLKDGEPKIETLFLESITSEQLILGLGLGDLENSPPTLSYLALASGTKRPTDQKKRAIDHAISLLAPIAETLASYLRSVGAVGATLISCGPISEAPLHAGNWIENGSQICLLDHWQLRIAPSATLQAECLKRAQEREMEEPFLLALGNPDLNDPRLDLPAAEREVRELSERFDSDRRMMAFRKEAGPDFLTQNVSGATHLHLACHASSGLFDYAEAKVHLAGGGTITGAELEALPFNTRIAVASACQTALVDMANLPDEAFSVSTSLLVAGSAAVIATQWPVNDEAASLLMSRFYNGLLKQGLNPAQALREAQLWLRDSESTANFSHPLYWAPFVMAGA